MPNNPRKRWRARMAGQLGPSCERHRCQDRIACGGWSAGLAMPIEETAYARRLSFISCLKDSRPWTKLCDTWQYHPTVAASLT